MSAPFARSSRRWRSEFLPLLSVVGLFAAIAWVFPRGTGLFSGRIRSAEPLVPSVRSACAFVSLTPDEEARALAAARASWQGAATHQTHRRIEMLPAELPSVPFAPAIDLSERPPADVSFRVRPLAAVLPPTAAAARAARITRAGDDAPHAAFPRELLLRLQ